MKTIRGLSLTIGSFLMVIVLFLVFIVVVFDDADDFENTLAIEHQIKNKIPQR